MQERNLPSVIVTGLRQVSLLLSDAAEGYKEFIETSRHRNCNDAVHC
jgi:hypothetical protein